MTESVAFDRIAERYDATRGGEARGWAHAVVLDEQLEPGSRVLEIGVGTGLVAAALAERGHDVVGVDLSQPMLAKAADRAERAGLRLLAGDAAVLPLAGASFDAVVAVWAIHVARPFEAVVAEVARVLVDGGRLLHIAATPDVNANDLNDIAFRLGAELGRDWDRSATLAPRMASLGFDHVGDTSVPSEPFERSPNDQADHLEGGTYSGLWNLDPDRWASIVQPILDGLRALPEPDRPRTCVHTHELSHYQLTRH